MNASSLVSISNSTPALRSAKREELEARATLASYKLLSKLGAASKVAATHTGHAALCGVAVTKGAAVGGFAGFVDGWQGK